VRQSFAGGARSYGRQVVVVNKLSEFTKPRGTPPTPHPPPPVGVAGSHQEISEHGRRNHIRHHAVANDGENAQNRISFGAQGQIFEKAAHRSNLGCTAVCDVVTETDFLTLPHRE